jgi:hypothetical protein
MLGGEEAVPAPNLSAFPKKRIGQPQLIHAAGLAAGA